MRGFVCSLSIERLCKGGKLGDPYTRFSQREGAILPRRDEEG